MKKKIMTPEAIQLQLLFGRKLKWLRDRRTQTKMAELVGIPQQAWERYEKGRSLPKIDVFYRICSKLFLSSDKMLDVNIEHSKGLVFDLDRPNYQGEIQELRKENEELKVRLKSLECAYDIILKANCELKRGHHED